MEAIKKYYLELNEPDANANALKIEIYYYLGGYNNFTSRAEMRGYYLSVTPVLRLANSERYVAFSGYKKLILSVDRKSKKAAERAVTLAQDITLDLINAVLTANNINGGVKFEKN